MDGLLDFFSREAGQRRRAALDEFGRDVGYYVPPELRGLLGFAAEMTPSATIERAAQAGMEMTAPDRTPMERVGSAGRMLSETAGVAAPMMVAGRAAMPAAQALQEGLLGFSMAGQGAADAGRRFLADEAGAINLWHGSPYDFDSFDLARIGSGEGAQDLGRGFSLTDEQAIAHLYTNPASRWGDLEAMRRYSEAGPGRYYNVMVDAEPTDFLDWNKPWREQVKSDTPLFNALKSEEDRLLQTYADDPAMVDAIPKAKLSQVWRDNKGLEDAATQSGYVGNLRKNYSGDTEYTVFDPARMQVAKKFDKDGNEIPLTSPAQEVATLLREGRADEVTDEMLGALSPNDNMELFDLYQRGATGMDLPMDEASRMARRDAMYGKDRFHGGNMDFAGFSGNVFTSDNPTVASTYNRGMLDAQIYPVVTREGPMGTVNVEGGMSNWNQLQPDMIDDPSIARELDRGVPISTRDIEREAVLEGRSGVTFRDINDLGPGFNSQQFKGIGYSPEQEEALRLQYLNELSVPSEVDVRLSPNLVRSRFARFDPRLAHLRNLSAGVAGAGLLATQQTEQEREDEIRQYLGGLL